MTACLAPACPRPRLEIGPWAFLCVEDALRAAGLLIAPQSPGPAVPGRQLVDVRGRCWGQALTCRQPATSITAHGTWCADHAPEQPATVEHVEDPAEERALQIATLTVLGAFEASIGEGRANLWASRAYGDSDQPAQVIPARTYQRRVLSRAVTVGLDDERVPRNARGMARNAKGWSVGLRHADALDEIPASLLLRAWRGAYLVVARWEGGSFAVAWLQHSRGTPVQLGARQASALLKLAP